MNYKVMNIIFLTFLIILILVYLIPSISFVVDAEDSIMNERFYPTIVGSIALILSIIKLIQIIVRIKDDKIFSVPNLRIIIITLVVTVIYVLLWYTFRDFFYIFTFLFIMTLSSLYSKARDKVTNKILLRNAIVSVSITLAIFVIFGQIFSVRF